jgi:biotin carboxyl carrier protein
VADVSEPAARTDSAAIDGGSAGSAIPPEAVRVSIVGSNPDDADARLVVAPGAETRATTVDGRPVAVALRWLDGIHARLETAPDRGASGSEPSGPRAPGVTPPTQVLVLPSAVMPIRSGAVRREVVVDGWRFEVEIESEARAALRERASRGAASKLHEGPFEVRAVIPGRIVSVEVAPGDSVVAGQRVMIIEAMKMQNELRMPRDGTVGRVVVGAGQTIEVGDLLLVLE